MTHCFLIVVARSGGEGRQCGAICAQGRQTGVHKGISVIILFAFSLFHLCLFVSFLSLLPPSLSDSHTLSLFSHSSVFAWFLHKITIHTSNCCHVFGHVIGIFVPVSCAWQTGLKSKRLQSLVESMSSPQVSGLVSIPHICTAERNVCGVIAKWRMW